MSDTKIKKKTNNLSYNAMLAAMNARIAVMLIGDPGTSKTATINQLAKELGYDLITIVPSRMDSQDISGFPTKGSYSYDEIVKPVTEYAPQRWQMEIMTKRKVILFLDEFSNAHPSVRASLLSFIQDRQFPNGDFFPEETIIVGAMNPTDSAADGYELDPATTNRMMFLSWNPDTDEWLEGMIDGWGTVPPEKENERLWRSLIVRFITNSPGSLHKMNQDIAGSAEAYDLDSSSPSSMAVLSYAWPSRRSWDNLAKVLGSLDESSDQNSAVEDEIMLGMIGGSEARRFRDWLRKNGKLNIKGILDNPDGFKKWDKIPLDDMNLILRSAVESINKDNFLNILRIFEIINEVDRGSNAAGFLSDLSKASSKATESFTPEKRDEFRNKLIEVIRSYKNVTRRNNNS